MSTAPGDVRHCVVPRLPPGSVRVEDRAVLDACDAAVAALGWDGLAAPPVRLLGVRVRPVVSIDLDAHRERVACGESPLRDGRRCGVGGAEPPDLPRPVVTLHGVLAEQRSWPAAVRAAVRMSGFGPTAVLRGSGPAAVGSRWSLECAVRGIAILASNGVTLVQPGHPDRAPGSRRRALDRWIEEQLYDHLLRLGMFGAAQVGTPAGPTRRHARSADGGRHDTSASSSNRFSA